MSTNTAAWLVAPKQRPLEVRSAPYTAPLEHEMVVKNGALAINPVDYYMHVDAILSLEYPTIGGFDIAG